MVPVMLFRFRVDPCRGCLVASQPRLDTPQRRLCRRPFAARMVLFWFCLNLTGNQLFSICKPSPLLFFFPFPVNHSGWVLSVRELWKRSLYFGTDSLYFGISLYILELTVITRSTDTPCLSTQPPMMTSALQPPAGSPPQAAHEPAKHRKPA